MELENIELEIKDLLENVNERIECGECFVDKDILKFLLEDIGKLNAEVTQYYYKFND